MEKKKRRKAIDCKLIKQSKEHDDYFKYVVTIQEIDGRVHDIPAYGKDMQEAISRLVWTERIEKISRRKSFNIAIVIAWLTTIIVPSIITSKTNNPLYVIEGISFSFLVGFIILKLDRYYNKF